ncbi:condensin complex subunit 3-like isoform X3 [Carassius auratus]|uniref:Condensin complex subunit 3-like isoform X3 n=1 Tax=Carassius auratus TaxID=7957 RepID=A0A6P6Q2I6_CARAU|nr:condensin complex subunit 3-like isoform X3 [Carassius auratus]
MGRGKISNINMSGDSDLEIEEAFRRAQKAHNNKAKLVASLKNRYNKLEDKTEFHEEFIRCLKYAMIIYTREPAVENVIEFVTRFAASFETPVNENAEEEEEDENEFLNVLLNFLLESHGANSHAVRFRSCQLVNKLLGSLGENAQIDDDLWDRIHEAMLIRVTDKYPNVRIQAALAMSRLQDPSNVDCPTIKAYMLLLENDSNPEVRRAVLSCIAPSATTLSKIYKRTRDVKEKVRKLAYQVLAEKVHIRALSIAQRVSLLHEGLSDSADSVKEVVKTHLLPAWLRMQQGDVLQLLHRLDVENCAETAMTTLQAIFSMASSPDDLLQNGVRLNERKLIPVDSLTCENVLYWRALCEFVKNKGNEGEELLEQLLPETAIFAEYLYSYLKSITQLSEEQRADMTQLEMVMTQEFIGQQLILLVGCLDTSEEGGRKRMVAVLQEVLLMSNTPSALIGLLVEKLIGILRDDAQKIQMIAEIISDVREPILPISEPVDENEKRRKQVKLAEVRVQIMEAKQTLEECISCQDFSRAAELKESISELEELKNQLVLEASQSADNIKEQRVEKSDPTTLLKCLTMCAELFKQMSIKRGICPTMNALIESLILPGVSNPNPAVRNMAVICLGTAALHSKDLANTHLVLLLQITQLDEPKIRISALRALIDQLLLNGLNILQDKPAPVSQDDSTEQPEHQAEEESTIQSILKMLSDFLDSEICELRTETAEGLARLMYCGRILSPKLLSRLVLLWYNPVTEDDQRLRHCLGVFLQLYARASRTNQECVEESFLPTMRTLFNAPVTSPLSEVDTSNVAELFVELTRPSTLVKPAAVQAVSVHDSLAVRVCNEILRDISAPEVRLFCKTLSWLEINTEPGPANCELQLLLKDILQEVKDKHCIRIIEKLCNQLNGDRCSKSAGNQDTTLQNLDDNNGEVNKDETKAKRAKRGQKKASTAKNGKKASKAELSSEESDEENVPEEPSSVRPTRRAKMAAIDKTKQDLTALMNQEANGS